MSSNPTFPGDAPPSGTGEQAASADADPPVAATEQPVLTDEEVAERHRAWMVEHGREYKDEAERERRLGIFRENLRYIEAHNRGGGGSYTLGLNQFADLTNEEFRTSFCGGLLLPPRESPPDDDDRSGVAEEEEEDSGGHGGPTPGSPPPPPRQDLAG